MLTVVDGAVFMMFQQFWNVSLGIRCRESSEKERVTMVILGCDGVQRAKPYEAEAVNLIVSCHRA